MGAGLHMLTIPLEGICRVPLPEKIRGLLLSIREQCGTDEGAFSGADGFVPFLSRRVNGFVHPSSLQRLEYAT